MGRWASRGSGAQGSFTINGRTVTISGDDTGTLTLTGRADDIQALLNDPTSGPDLSQPRQRQCRPQRRGRGDVTIHDVSLSEGAAAVGENTGGNYTPDRRHRRRPSNATNDAPTVSAGSGTIVAGRAGVEYPITGVSVADPDIADGVDPGETDFIQVTVRLLDQGNTPLTLARYAGITLDSADTSGAVQIVSG